MPESVGERAAAGEIDLALTAIFNHGFTRRAGRHGIGLHASACAAGELGGTLLAASDGPGRGARFTLTLPLHVAEAIAAGAGQ